MKMLYLYSLFFFCLFSPQKNNAQCPKDQYRQNLKNVLSVIKKFEDLNNFTRQYFSENAALITTIHGFTCCLYNEKEALKSEKDLWIKFLDEVKEKVSSLEKVSEKNRAILKTIYALSQEICTKEEQYHESFLDNIAQTFPECTINN